MKSAYNYLKKEISENATIIAAISGGADSMALLHLLLTLKETKAINIICAHVNHNIRKESATEAKMVEKYCKKNKIIFESMTIEEYQGNNFENEARTKRYVFFEQLVHKYNATYLMTAHHADDLIETILMRIVRGSTLKGYAGFEKETKKNNYKILRPLINVTKDEILKYIEEFDVDYANDESNMSDDFTRNRYRKYVLPFLKKEDANVHEKFFKFSELLIESNRYIEEQSKKEIKKVFKDNVIYKEKFKKNDEVIQDRIINYIMQEKYKNDLTLITDVNKKVLVDLINSEKPNTYVYLPNDLKAIKAYDEITFEGELKKEERYKIKFNDCVKLPNGKKIEMISDNDEKSNFICRLNSKEITMPLYVRSKQDGDVMEVKGLSGRKKIKDIFINEKISIKERERWPVLIDDNDNILWLPGLKKSKYDKSKKENYDIIIKYY